MANRFESGQFFEDGGDSIEFHRREVTSRVMPLVRKVDAEVAQRIGFQGNIFDVFTAQLQRENGSRFVEIDSLPSQLHDHVVPILGSDGREITTNFSYDETYRSSKNSLKYSIKVYNDQDEIIDPTEQVEVSLDKGLAFMHFSLENSRVSSLHAGVTSLDKEDNQAIEIDFASQDSIFVIHREAGSAAVDISYGQMDELGDVEFEGENYASVDDHQYFIDENSAFNNLTVIYERGSFTFPYRTNVYDELGQMGKRLERGE